MDERDADRESARDRHARFGTLPARIDPDATVETVATEPPRSVPPAAGSEEQRQALLGGG